MKQPHPLKTGHLAIVIPLDSKKNYKLYYELTKNNVPACGPPASFSVHLASHSGRVCPQIQGRQCGAYVGAVEEMMRVVCVLQRGHSGDGCVLASTLCKYDLRKGDLFVLSRARVRRVRRGSISSELLSGQHMHY